MKLIKATFKIKFPILLHYNSPTYCNHMLNPSILDGWEDYTLAKQLYLAKAATITGEHPETRVKEEAPNVVVRKYTSGTEGNSPALLRLRCVTKGKKGTVLVLTASVGTPSRKHI